MKNNSKIRSLVLLALVILLSLVYLSFKVADTPNNMENAEAEVTVLYKTKNIEGVDIFYRESGNPKNPALILFHGFPSSSYQYRKVLAALGDDYYLIAPDYPAFGQSQFPSPKEFDYTFDNMAHIMNEFVASFELESYTLMMHDYGGPVGFRIALKNPEKVNGLIIKNANIYEEGLGAAWMDVRKLWKANTTENREPLKKVFHIESLKWQYTHGVKKPEMVSPDNWVLDAHNMSSPEMREVQLDLFYDYRKNLEEYPKWQKYLRRNQPPMLIVWGKNDAFFPESGAEAYKKDVQKIDYNIYDTGHFALEEHAHDIIPEIRSFLNQLSQKN
ncbi:alpha/beta fold hydrolase [Maribacter sp. 2308TA10-17]|uniref:alpha/beta fold hydrolase n=1 Tax=Maribacter sp. 2308TA10-17 TaxID=3386276 RepID=UPI0039BCDD13